MEVVELLECGEDDTVACGLIERDRREDMHRHLHELLLLREK
jgi:hypothetical protein